MVLRYPLLLSYTCKDSNGRGQDDVALSINTFQMGVIQSRHQSYCSHMAQAIQLVNRLVDRPLTAWDKQV